jgi:hypothetical protein
MDKILEDLDFAIANLRKTGTAVAGALDNGVALALKSRSACLRGGWRKVTMAV